LTANELLALLGRAWPRLLLYPGGLAAFALVWLIGATKNQEPRTENRVALPGSRFSVLGSLAIVAPWLGLALLPLPLVAELSRSIDVVALLALLEWPLLLVLAAELRSGEPATLARGTRRLAAALNSYPALVLALLLLASAAGSLDSAALARPPDENTPPRAVLLHWAGAAAVIGALPPALGIGAFAAGASALPWARIGLRLRAIGLVALAALPWFPLVPLPPLAIAALLWAFARLTAGRSARHWARIYLVFDALLLMVLLGAAYAALQERIG
jgi:hypothetical protein